MSVPPAASPAATATHHRAPSSSAPDRRNSGKGKRAIRAAAGRAAGACLAEELEPRRLFTTIGANNLFRYRDIDGHFFTIRTGPGLIAELVGSTVNTAQTAITLGDLRAVGNGAPNDLYAIYVAQSTPDSWITVTADHVIQPQQDPFRGTVAPINIFDNQGRRFLGNAPVIATGAANMGIGFLGGRIPAIPQPAQDPNAPLPSPFFPQITQNVPQLGVIPANANVQAGFYVADGNDFGRFIFDGAVGGRVNVGGNMDTFWCGWLLTGNTQGIIGPPYTITVTNNFNVDGDIRNIFSLDSIGTENTEGGDQRYSTGFDLQVGGRLSSITTRDTFMGKLDVHNAADPDNPTRPGIQTPDREIEFIQSGGNNPNPNADLIPTTSAGGTDFSVRNDDFAHPQILSTHLQDLPGLGQQQVASVTGLLQDLGALGGARDGADYYGVALMAGQKVVIDVDGLLLPAGIDSAGILDIALIDPDGRIVASDYTITGLFAEPFGYTADRPGLYRVVVATNGNTDFQGLGAPPQGLISYTITVRGVGDLPMGGMSATNNIIGTVSAEVDPDPERPTNTTEPSIRVRRANMGAILTQATIRNIGLTMCAVDHGDLRAIEANQIGNSLIDSLVIEVPNGNVGLLDSNGICSVITGLDDLIAPIPIGQNMQVMSAGGTFFGDLRVDGGIGVIRAGDLATPAAPSQLFVDFDRNGGGFIDMIDCVGNLGTITAGGPAIDTGVGGNVRYISCGGQVFGDTTFFGNVQTPVQYAPGQDVTVVDDGGARLTFSPITNQVATPTTPVTPAALTILAYPIRSGGSVVMDVVSDGSVEIDAGGGGNLAEVSRVQVQGAGRTVVNASDLIPPPTPVPDATNRGDLQIDQMLLNPTGPNLEALFTGDVPIDVLNVVVLNLAGALGNATAIQNETGGEIVNVVAASIGELSARGPIGVPKNSSGAALVRARSIQLGNGLEAGPRPVYMAGGIDVGNTFPFLQQTTGITVSGGNVASISSSMGIGNVAVNGSIQSITPNADGKDDGGAFEGINGPVVAFNGNGEPAAVGGRGIAATARLAGRINFVNIGDGVLPSGSGAVSRAGIYADRPVGVVKNQGLESDIRGNIVSRTAINRVSLNDGAIIGSLIVIFSQFEMSSLLGPGATVPPSQGIISTPQFEIGGIDLTGRGGILSSEIGGADLGPVKIDGGFGFIRSFLVTISATRVEGLQTDGYGIRDAFITTGASGGSISARGDGSSASILRYTPSVRYAEKSAVDPEFLDPFFDVPPNFGTDLYLALNTTPAAPEVAGTTDTGVIEDSTIVGSGQLSSVSAYTIRAMFNGVPVLRDPNILLVGVDPSPERSLELMRISVGDAIGSLVTRGPINGLYLSTGRIGTFAPGSDLFNTDVQINGPIALFKVNGNFADTSNLVASGPNGRIKKLQVFGNLVGDVTSTGKIGDVLVSGLVAGKIESKVNGGRSNSINSINIGGITPDGQLNIVGNLGKLIVDGDLGTIGSVNNQVQVTGSAKSIRINGDLQTNINVTQNLGTLDVRGSILSSNVTVADTLKALKVTGDISADSTVTARILKKQAIKGNVFGQIVITG